MRRLVLAWSLALALTGCGGWQERPQTAAPLIKAPASAGEAIEIAQDLAGRGRWSDAIGVLAATAKRFPDDGTLGDARAVMEARWARARRVLEDQILVDDAENQQRKVALLESLSLAEPDNLIVIARRIYWREMLAAKTEPLTACAEHQAATVPALARRCYLVAADLAVTEDIERRLAKVSEQLRANEDIAAERRRAREQKERSARAKVLLDNAKVAIEGHDYRRALNILEQVAELQPNNRELIGLQQEALSMISPQVEALVKLGDHLYLDEQLHAAVATWQAALGLRPDDPEILARIERARNVLDRLDTLRRQQKMPAVGE